MELIVPNYLVKLIIQTIQVCQKTAVKLDDIFRNYFNKTFIEDVICENCSLVHSEAKNQHSHCGEI